MPKGITGWTLVLMHASEAFILTVFAAFVAGIPFQSAPEKIIVLHCLVTVLLFGLSVIMKIKGDEAASTGFMVATLGIISAFFLLPVLGK